jgi:uncharacterized protein (TIGR02646 family)
VLRSALRQISHEKCAYCEGRLGAQAGQEIEHYLPKANVNLAFEWTNLLPSCGLCNQAKKDEDHGGMLVKPDVEDPEPFFFFDVDSGELQPHPSLKGRELDRSRESIRICNLNRAGLCQSRIIVYVDLMGLLASESDSSSSAVKDAMRMKMAADHEYKFVVRTAFQISELPERAEEDRENFRNGR